MIEAPDLSEQRFVALIPVSIRPGRAEDLPALEWCGAYREHRELLARTFAATERGTQLMWVADLGGFPVGQIWADLERDRLWAARVFPALRGRGIGSRLARVAEHALHARGRSAASVSVEMGNTAALHFWMREGYRVAGLVCEEWSHVTPDGMRVEVLSSLQRLEKDLTEASPGAASVLDSADDFVDKPQETLIDAVQQVAPRPAGPWASAVAGCPDREGRRHGGRRQTSGAGPGGPRAHQAACRRGLAGRSLRRRR